MASDLGINVKEKIGTGESIGPGKKLPERLTLTVKDREVQLWWKNGKYLGLCPFHRETSPSFVVDLNAKRFQCFGCGERGKLK